MFQPNNKVKIYESYRPEIQKTHEDIGKIVEKFRIYAKIDSSFLKWFYNWKTVIWHASSIEFDMGLPFFSDHTVFKS